MASRRKGWEQLSDNYRRRLERSGVTKTQYESSAPLHKARGHTSQVKESAAKRQQRSIARWVVDYAKTYGKDEDDLRDALKELEPAERLAWIGLQEDAQREYDIGNLPNATAIWRSRPAGQPEWMFFYHGVFK